LAGDKKSASYNFFESMKKTIINIICAIVGTGALVVSVLVPWWAVWFICFPVMFWAVIIPLKTNTNYITHYGGK